MDQLPTLHIPSSLTFGNKQQSQIIKIENPYDRPIVYKIKTNRTTAIQIPISHGFLMGKTTRQLPIVLSELATGVKLQFSYSWATDQMVIHGDSKMKSVQKSKIKKFIIEIMISPDTQPKESQKKIQQKINQSQYKLQEQTMISRQPKLEQKMKEQPKQQKHEKANQLQPKSQKKKQASNQKIEQYANKFKPSLTLTNVTSHRELNKQISSNIIKLIEEPDQQDKEEIMEQIRKFNQQLEQKKLQYQQNSKNIPVSYHVIILTLLFAFLFGVICKSVMTYILLNNEDCDEQGN